MSLERGAGGFSREWSRTDKARKTSDLHTAGLFREGPRKSLARRPFYDEKKLLKKEPEALELYNIGPEIPHGHLCTIAGPVGAGGRV